jgi:hypothetical protein
VLTFRELVVVTVKELARVFGPGNLSYCVIDCQLPMPEDGWTALTVREHVGAMIKALARSRELTVSDHFERLIVVEQEKA